jgi:hypothetical protein
MAEDDPPLVDPVLKDFKFPERVERVFGIRKIDFNLPNPIALANWIWLMQQLLVYLVQRWLNMNKKTPISQQEMDDAVAYSLQQ